MLKTVLLLLGASTVWQLASPALASEVPSRNPLVALEDHRAAVEEGRRLGIGSVTLVRPAAQEPLVAAENTTFEFSYETQMPIETGGYI